MGKLLILIVIVFIAASAVSAKFEPFIEDPEAEWGDLDASWEVENDLAFNGLYGHLENETDIDAFALTFDEAVTAFSIRLIVPVCGSHFEDFYPSVAVIGAGFDIPQDIELPFELPEGMGALVLTELDQPDERPIMDGNGTYTRSDYFSLWHSVDLPEAGAYTLAVWEPEGQVGAYVLATGREHPEMDVSDEEQVKARADAFTQIEAGSWINANCDAQGS